MRTSVTVTCPTDHVRFHVVSDDAGTGMVELDLERKYAVQGPDGLWHYELGQSIDPGAACALGIALITAAYHATLNGDPKLRVESSITLANARLAVANLESKEQRNG